MCGFAWSSGARLRLCAHVPAFCLVASLVLVSLKLWIPQLKPSNSVCSPQMLHPSHFVEKIRLVPQHIPTSWGEFPFVLGCLRVQVPPIRGGQRTAISSWRSWRNGRLWPGWPSTATPAASWSGAFVGCLEVPEPSFPKLQTWLPRNGNQQMDRLMWGNPVTPAS